MSSRNKWFNLPGMLILMGTARSTTMSGSQWWHQSKLTSASILSSSIKKIIWKSRSEAGSIFAPGFRSWKVLFFHIRPPLLCHDFYLFINSLFWCQINFPLPKVFHILIEGTFSKSFEQCTFEGTNLSMCIKQPHSQIYCMHAQINLPELVLQNKNQLFLFEIYVIL